MRALSVSSAGMLFLYTLRRAGVTIDGVQTLLPAILSALHIETLVHGNASETSARKLVQTIERCLGKRDDGTSTLQPLYSNQIWRAREVELNEGERAVPVSHAHTQINPICTRSRNRHTQIVV